MFATLHFECACSRIHIHVYCYRRLVIAAVAARLSAAVLWDPWHLLAPNMRPRAEGGRQGSRGDPGKQHSGAIQASVKEIIQCRACAPINNLTNTTEGIEGTFRRTPVTGAWLQGTQPHAGCHVGVPGACRPWSDLMSSAVKSRSA